ncbi:hypothetical protein PUMCH_002531 [Australozyma saopauloensis]|uniref:Signal recognition particle subunit SRP68 n=1 Tax=Australozyma saopauloensis TaxID=291208 RepID=A0AAX4H9M0_9ASCO|nr:hypothetical protein PUMCH_002531 [[Candida] saopauloensis]
MSLTSPLGITYGERTAAFFAAPEDFRKYRKSINKRLLKLRHELGIVTKDTRNYQEKEQTSSISASLYEADVRNGLLLLLLAERDVVHALEVKSQLEVSPERSSSHRKLMSTKLKKAVSTCRKLLDVTQNESSAVRRLELYLYAALVHGTYSLNKQRWSEALYNFSIARCGLELLSSRSNESGLAEPALMSKLAISELLDTLVDPSLNLTISQHAAIDDNAADVRTIARKHCRDGTVGYLKPCFDLIVDLDSSFVEEIEEEQVSKTITWRQHEATLHNDELAVKLARVNRLDWRAFSEPEQFDGLYSQWSALVDLHTADLSSNKDEDDEMRVQDGAILLTYLRYNMFFVRVRRDLLLVDKLSAQKTVSSTKTLRSSKDVLRLYSSIDLTVSEIKDLPGVYNDDELFQSLENLSLFFTAKRSLVVALCYSAVYQADKALTILLHLKRTFSVSEDFYKVSEFPYDVTSYSQAKDLEQVINKRSIEVSALSQVLKSQQRHEYEYISDNVNKFDFSLDSINHVINADKIGGINPVLSKPVLFDIAFNYIGYANEETIQPKVEKAIPAKPEEEKKKSGLFGLFGR